MPPTARLALLRHTSPNRQRGDTSQAPSASAGTPHTSPNRQRGTAFPSLALRAGVAACALALGLPAPAGARPAHKQALIDLFGPALPKKLHDCRTCHLPLEPG